MKNIALYISILAILINLFFFLNLKRIEKRAEEHQIAIAKAFILAYSKPHHPCNITTLDLSYIGGNMDLHTKQAIKEMHENYERTKLDSATIKAIDNYFKDNPYEPDNYHRYVNK